MATMATLRPRRAECATRSVGVRPVKDGVEGSRHQENCRRLSNGVAANVMFLDGDTSVNFAFPNIPGRTFFQSSRIRYFCSGPISADPICQQPKDYHCYYYYVYYYYYYYYYYYWPR